MIRPPSKNLLLMAHPTCLLLMNKDLRFSLKNLFSQPSEVFSNKKEEACKNARVQPSLLVTIPCNINLQLTIMA